MLFLYLVLVWFLFTAIWSGSRPLRKSAVCFLVWCGLTAVVLWPVARRMYGSPQLQAIAREVSDEWSAEMAREPGQ